VDVCVIGAGIGGLATARALVAHGSDVTVIEARPRVGGRLHSVPLDGGWIDLGATWFWPHERRIISLVRDLDIDVFAHHLDGDALYDTGDAPHRIDGNPIDVPAGRFTGGAASLAEAVALRLPVGTVRFGSPARRIALDGGRWLIATDTEQLAADHVVIAVPPALAIASITFDPDLPAPIRSLAAATPVWMGHTTKAVAVYPRPFWRAAGLSGSAVSHVGPLRELHDLSGPRGSPAALFGFAPSGPQTIDETAVVAQLVRLFGDEAADTEAVIVADWSKQPFTTPAAGAPGTDYTTYGHRRYQEAMLGGTAHWAATETSPDQAGHIEGALAAAERTVAAIVAPVTDEPSRTNHTETPDDIAAR
jgi:monoamine oxidase